MIGLDASILMQAIDPSSVYYESAKNFISSGSDIGFLLPISCALELYSNLTKKREMPSSSFSQYTSFITDFLSSYNIKLCNYPADKLSEFLIYASNNKLASKQVFDLEIALTLVENSASELFTLNTASYAPFTFITVRNPLDPGQLLHHHTPSGQRFIPYGRQSIDESDIDAVSAVLRSDWLTTGPKVAEFEELFAQKVGAKHAVAVSNGTAALHAAMYALGIGPGDEVIVSPITFAASANSIVFQGGTPVFADVESTTLLIDPKAIESKITPKTRAIVAIDYAGHPCDYDALHAIADRHGLSIIDDACHSLGAAYKNRPAGSLANLNVFSFHPVKHITSGEGGMITTDDPALLKRLRLFRNHGITSEHRQREAEGSWFYEMVDLGYNYRLTDFQCALGISQLSKLSNWIIRRRQIAAQYDSFFSKIPCVRPLEVSTEVSHAYHLYIVRLGTTKIIVDRGAVFRALRSQQIGVNVHYIPVHLHPYYRDRFGTGPGLCPIAESAYNEILTLPLFHGMTDGDAFRVMETVAKVVETYTA